MCPINATRKKVSRIESERDSLMKDCVIASLIIFLMYTQPHPVVFYLGFLVNKTSPNQTKSNISKVFIRQNHLSHYIN